MFPISIVASHASSPTVPAEQRRTRYIYFSHPRRSKIDSFRLPYVECAEELRWCHHGLPPGYASVGVSSCSLDGHRGRASELTHLDIRVIRWFHATVMLDEDLDHNGNHPDIIWPRDGYNNTRGSRDKDPRHMQVR